MNPDILPIMQNCLARGFKLLVLTNAMRPMMRPRIQAGLLDLKKQFAEQLTLRVSIDHFDPALHEQERGPGSWSAMIRGLQWLQRNGFAFHIAGRRRWGDSEAEMRQGYARVFDENWVFESIRMIHRHSSYSRKSTPPARCRKSPPRAGAFWV